MFVLERGRNEVGGVVMHGDQSSSPPGKLNSNQPKFRYRVLSTFAVDCALCFAISGLTAPFEVILKTPHCTEPASIRSLSFSLLNN